MEGKIENINYEIDIRGKKQICQQLVLIGSSVKLLPTAPPGKTHAPAQTL